MKDEKAVAVMEEACIYFLPDNYVSINTTNLTFSCNCIKFVSEGQLLLLEL